MSNVVSIGLFGLPLIFGLILREFFDSLAASAPVDLSVQTLIVLYAVVIFSHSVVSIGQSASEEYFGVRLMSRLQGNLFRGIMSGPPLVSAPSPGDMVNRIVPSLVAFFLLDHIATQGIALTVALADSSAGVATHARSKNINYGVLLYIAPVALLAAIAGALVSHQLPEPVLRNLFGAFTVAIWLILASRLIGVTLRQQRRSSAGHR